MTPRLHCEGLTGGRGRAVAFRDVDLTVAAGEVLAVVGPNGAGKTSLLLTIAGLLPPIAGGVAVDGRRVAGGRPRAASRSGVVLVPDERALFSGLTVVENLRAASYRGGPTPRDMLEVFPALERRWTVPAAALSGGEQQMLAVARGLIQQPRILMIDEMSMGLAPLVVAGLFENVRNIADDHGCAVLLVEQHVQLALEVADRAVVLSHGSVVLEDAAASLLAEPDRLSASYFGRDGSSDADTGPAPPG